MIFIIKQPVLLWVAWPLIACGGLSNHVANTRSCRTTPSFATAFQAMAGGCMSAAASTPFIWKMMRDKNLV